MADEIVSCPGCGKKFKIPAGAPGGTFQCTACNATVPYGKAVRPGAAPVAAPAAARAPAKPAASEIKGGGSPSVAGRRAAARRRAATAGAARAMHAEPEETPEEKKEAARRAREQKAKESRTITWIVIGGVVAICAITFFVLSRKSPDPPPFVPTTPPVDTTPTTPTTPVDPAPTPATPPAAGAGGGAGDGTAAPDEGSGIGGARANPNAGSSTVGWSTPGDELFVVIPDVPGVTPQEREAMDKDVALFVDKDAGRPGNVAGDRLKKLGRRAVPSLLSSFRLQWQGKKWEDDSEKFACFKAQELLVTIVKADRPGGDFVARWTHVNCPPAKDFERAARMWVVWWQTKGKDLEKFADFPE